MERGTDVVVGRGRLVGEEKELCIITRPLGGSWVHGTVFDVQKREETDFERARASGRP